MDVQTILVDGNYNVYSTEDQSHYADDMRDVDLCKCNLCHCMTIGKPISADLEA